MSKHFNPGSPVRVTSGAWSGALGVVTQATGHGARVRLGDGRSVWATADAVELAEQGPGAQGGPASFPPGTSGFPPRR